MNSSNPLSRRVFLAAVVAVSAAGYVQLPTGPAAAAVVADPAPGPHNTLLGVL